MRKRQFSKSLSVALSEDQFELIKKITDEEEISMAEWVRETVEIELSKKKKILNDEIHEVDNKVDDSVTDKRIIKRTKEEDIRQLNAIEYIIANEDEYYSGVVSFDGLYEYYLENSDKDIYSKSDVINLLVWNDYVIRISREHDSLLCVFYEGNVKSST